MSKANEKKNLAKSTKIVAEYVGRGVVTKDGPTKGKKFYKYNLSGPSAEIKEFMEHPDSKEYGVKYAADGETVQYWCNWKDPFGTIGTRYSVNVSIYGTYVLDKQESYDIEDTLEAMESKGLHTAARVYAENKLGSRLGFGLNRANVSAIAAGMSTGEGADLGNSE